AEVDPMNDDPGVGKNPAVSECVPMASVVISVAVPLDTGTGLPMLAVPSMNCTEPVAVDGITVAVNVSTVPATVGGAGVTVSAVLVNTGGGLITYVTTFDVDGSKAVGSVGMNIAVSECVPSDNWVKVVTVPSDATGSGVPMSSAPSLNRTEPTGTWAGA